LLLQEVFAEARQKGVRSVSLEVDGTLAIGHRLKVRVNRESCLINYRKR
jgi:hypothetical protein